MHISKKELRLDSAAGNRKLNKNGLSNSEVYFPLM